MMEISPAERVKINQLIFRLGLEKVPPDTNVMAWVLPTLEAIVKRFDAQDKRIRELEIALPKSSSSIGT